MTEKNEPASSLTKREFFAAIAMQGILANRFCSNIADQAISYADDLIEKLNKEHEIDLPLDRLGSTLVDK